MKINFKKLSSDELSGHIRNLGQRPFRASQISNWIYKKFAMSFDDMTDLSINLREQLNKTAYISNLIIRECQVSRDGTMKFLFELEDGETIESVLIPNALGDNACTLCISSQVGCAMNCEFCMTGKLGLKRNLKAYEIYDQVISVNRHIASSAKLPVPVLTNIVFMGMGEPFKNINEVVKAIKVLNGPLDISRRRITVSTSGVVPGFQKLAEHELGVNIAVSLNATTDDIRSRIMPVNKKYPINKLLEACRKYPLKRNRSITFEYVLLGGINDSKEDAVRLIHLIHGTKSKVNLIPYNPAYSPCSSPSDETDRIDLKKSSEKKVLAFQEILHKAGIITIIRKSKGSDISAACGQLKALYR